MYFYHFTAVYFLAAHRFMVLASNDVDARRKAREVARKALCIVLVAVEH